MDTIYQKLKTLILETYYAPGGMEQYSLIFKNIYGVNLQKTKTLFHSNYWLRIIQVLLFRKKVLREIQMSDYQLIHITNNTMYDFWIIKALVKRPGLKVLYTMHDPIPHSTNSFTRNIINKLLLIQNKRILKFASRNFYVLVHSLDSLPIKTKTSNILYYAHPYSIVNENVEDIFKLNQTNKIKISFLGRIDKYKGIDRFIKVLLSLDSVVTEKYFITIAGKGDIFQKIERTDSLVINRINRFLTENEFDSIIKYSDIIILPYLDATSSGVLSRVIPFNKRVIISNIPSLTSYCKNYENHVVFNSNDHLCQVLTNELTFFSEPLKKMESVNTSSSFIDDIIIKEIGLKYV